MSGCELCNLEKKTKWYYEDKEWIICDCDCETCKIPMIVSKKHFMPSLDDVGFLQIDLRKIVNKVFGNRFQKFRKYQRKVKDHFHWHIILEKES